MSSMKDLRLTITSALERLRLESDTLQREDASLRAREERMVASFERLKEKEANYKDRGKIKFLSYINNLFSLMDLLNSSIGRR